jgi:hypothetical protein
VSLYINEWLVFLSRVHGAMGIPLVVCGVALMVFGWRLWKLCVMVSFGLIGAGLGAWLVGPGPAQWVCAVAAGALLGVASYWPVNYAISLLGGVIVAALVMNSAEGMGLAGTALWITGGVACLAGAAYAHLNRQYVVILVTAFLGATLLLSGLAVWTMGLPSLWGTLRSLLADSIVVLPFLLLVPTVMSAFYQMAEVRRCRAEL